MTTPDIRLPFAGILGMLQAAVAFPIGDHEVPKPEDRLPRKPWGVVYLIDGGEFDGPPLTAPNADASFIVQIDVVGARPDHALWGGDMVRRTMISRSASGAFQVASPDLEALKVSDRLPMGGPSGLVPGGDPGHRVYSWSERYAIYVTPS